MGLARFSKFKLTRYPLYSLARWRTAEKVAELQSHLGTSEKILDVGAGNCVLCERLLQAQFDVTPLDIADSSVVDSIKPHLYDGTRIPFSDDSFDIALLITVLHHIPDPDAVLRETRRVAKGAILSLIHISEPTRYSRSLGILRRVTYVLSRK